METGRRIGRVTDPSNAEQPVGGLCDDHALSARSRAYAESVVRGDDWPLADLDSGKVAWATSTRARRKNGFCTYEPDGHCTVSVGAHVHERAGFDACKETIRHELVHVWQHQHAGERAALTEDGPRIEDDGDVTAERAIRIEPGHGPSFSAWVGPLELSGRCSTPYERTRADYAYVFECPACGEWWGRHRLCKSVRQAAHGRAGGAGYRYCADCESLVHLRANGRYLEHGTHDDEAIRDFAGGDVGGLPTASPERLTPAAPPAADD